MPATEVCLTEDFIAEATPQSASLEEAASTQEILIQQLEGYLNRMREATCADLTSLQTHVDELQVQLDACDCEGGGGGLPDLVAGVEILSGRQVLGNDSYFKLISMGGLPNTATITVAHGLVAPYTMVHIYSTANDPVANDHVPIPFVQAPTGTFVIRLSLIGPNILITTAANWLSYTQCQVILEYTKV